MKVLKNKLIVVALCAVGLVVFILSLESYQKTAELEQKIEYQTELRNLIDNSFGPGKIDFPEKLIVEDKPYNINYATNPDLTSHIRKLLKRYRPDYTAVVVIDNNNGNILTAIGHQRHNNQANDVLPFTSTHPSASLFKIVTSASLLDDGEITEDSRFKYRGKGTTLYKYQLKNKETKWTRSQDLKSAFAYSNNVVFGKAAINNLTSDSLYLMAEKFGFNEDLMVDVNLSKSRFLHAHSDYHLAELASGFNKDTLISPIHGAVLASIVANEGELIYPRLVLNIASDGEKSEIVWSNDIKKREVFSKDSAQYIEELMEFTAKRGTARRLERGLPYKLRRDLSVGAKTGSITGGIPEGKRDWVTAFAKPNYKGSSDKGISICVMIVNQKKWYIKSTYLTEKIIEYYYKTVSPLNEIASLSSN